MPDINIDNYEDYFDSGHKFTKQETFNLIVEHLREQGAPAQNEGGCCKFRVGDLKCAVGSLIPDKYYSSELEECLGIVFDVLGHQHDKNTLDAMLSVHDGMDVDDWENGFEIVAKKFGLKVPSED